MVLGIKPKALRTLGKCSTTERCAQPQESIWLGNPLEDGVSAHTHPVVPAQLLDVGGIGSFSEQHRGKPLKLLPGGCHLSRQFHLHQSLCLSEVGVCSWHTGEPGRGTMEGKAGVATWVPQDSVYAGTTFILLDMWLSACKEWSHGFTHDIPELSHGFIPRHPRIESRVHPTAPRTSRADLRLLE